MDKKGDGVGAGVVDPLVNGARGAQRRSPWNQTMSPLDLDIGCPMHTPSLSLNPRTHLRGSTRVPERRLVHARCTTYTLMATRSTPGLPLHPQEGRGAGGV